jgi:hypothetical protein
MPLNYMDYNNLPDIRTGDRSNGTTNRERQSLANRNQQSRAILAIWNNVLTIQPEMVKDLSGMLNTHLHLDLHRSAII